MDEEGVTAVLGTVLMLALLLTLLPGAIMMRAAVSEEMDAQREAAELAAYCARNPDVGPPVCDQRGPLPGYQCAQTELDVWVCTRPAPTPVVIAPAVTTAPTVSTPLVTTSPALGV